MKQAEYKIDTLNDMLEIPPEAFERFLAEIRPVLRQLKQVHEINAALGGVVSLTGMTWVDDDKHDIDMNFNVAVDGVSVTGAEA